VRPTAAAGSTVSGVVSTRGHFESDFFESTVRLAPGITEREFETSGTVPGFDEPADDLFVFAHGLWTDEQGATQSFERCAEALEAANADVPVVGFSYDSDEGSTSGQNAEIARRNGPKLGHFVRELRERTPDVRIHLVGYSLGALVALSTLEFLEASETDLTIDTVHLLGGSAKVDSITNEGRYGPGVESAAGAVYNYHKTNDLVLKFFTLFETPSIGQVGVDTDRTPSNVVNVDVTDAVLSHLTYHRKWGGCMDQVATRL
jgi:esterase/lipase superfamily enzyme